MTSVLLLSIPGTGSNRVSDYLNKRHGGFSQYTRKIRTGSSYLTTDTLKSVANARSLLL